MCFRERRLKRQTGSGSHCRPGLLPSTTATLPHAGLKVVGDTPFKYLAVHVVDKGAPLYDAPK